MMSSLDEQLFFELFQKVQSEVFANAKDKGWWDERCKLMGLATLEGMGDYARKMIISNLICLAHSELSEGLEGLRDNLQDDKCPEFDMLTVELADTIIRIMDLAEGFNLPLARAMAAKMRMNQGREHMHGGKAF